MRFARSIRATYGVILGVLLIGAVTLPIIIAQLEIYLQKKPVFLRETLATIPSSLGAFSVARDKDGNPIPDELYGPEMLETLGTDMYLARNYESQGAQVNVHVAYYTDQIDDVPHVPERCFAAAGLTQSMPPRTFELDVTFDDALIDETSPINVATQQPYPRIETTDAVGNPVTIHLPVGDLQMTVTEFQPAPEKAPRVRQVGGYFFVANGRTTDSALAVENVAFDLTSPYGYYCKVQLNQVTRTLGDDDRTVAEFKEKARDFMTELLPHLAAVLPDWREYESVDGVVEVDRIGDTESADAAEPPAS